MALPPLTFFCAPPPCPWLEYHPLHLIGPEAALYDGIVIIDLQT